MLIATYSQARSVSVTQSRAQEAAAATTIKPEEEKGAEEQRSPENKPEKQMAARKTAERT